MNENKKEQVFTFEQRVRANPRRKQLGRWAKTRLGLLGKPRGEAGKAGGLSEQRAPVVWQDTEQRRWRGRAARLSGGAAPQRLGEAEQARRGRAGTVGGASCGGGSTGDGGDGAGGGSSDLGHKDGEYGCGAVSG
jgi:hypothetical protein